MGRNIMMILVLVGLTLMVGVTASPGSTERGAGTLRVGVYDSRAIAVAFAGSKLNPMGEKIKAYEQAKAAGDEKQVKELEAWGEKLQRQLHRQGFGRVPVTDLLELVKDRLPEVAKKAGVAVITFDCNYRGPGVELVDVTMDLVMLFDPSDKTLHAAEEIQEVEPVDLDEIDHDH